MFKVIKHAAGHEGAFVKLVRVADDDYAVVVRNPSEAKLNHRYIGPDPGNADEVFEAEAGKLGQRSPS
jgi:hypothetical protein